MKIVTGSLLIGFFIIVMIAVTVKSISFTQGCGGHLKRAADANTIKMAVDELDISIKYMEDNDMTKGYTSIIYKTPDEDVGFWYNNVKSSRDELVALSDSVSPLERSNMLMKLRETLLDNGGEGTSLTCPGCISQFPNNALWAILILMSMTALVGGGILFIQVLNDL